MATISRSSRISSRSFPGMKGWTEEWALTESITQIFQTGTRHLSDETNSLRFFLSWSAQKKRNISILVMSCLIWHTHRHTHLSSVTINTLTSYFISPAALGVFFALYFYLFASFSQYSLCCCLHFVIVIIFLINLFIIYDDYFTYLLIT